MFGSSSTIAEEDQEKAVEKFQKELLYIPFFGWALRCMKPITLNRANKFSSLKKVIDNIYGLLSSVFNNRK